MQITENKAVALAYTLTVDGLTVDSTSEAQPLWYIHGRGTLLPKFEEALTNHKTGDSIQLKLAPEHGYGVFDDNLVVKIPKIQLDGLESHNVGDTIEATTKHNQKVSGVIQSIEKDTVTANFNHELAGKELNFDIRVLEVRLATPKELSKGYIGPDHEHVHGPECAH